LPDSNLPIQLSTFIGREREIATVTRLLQGTRLLTLTGPGGCGKTRLALAVAEGRARRYPGGVRLVELASLSDPRLVPHAVAAAFDLRESPGGAPLIETLAAHLKTCGAVLLVLDNCEHLVEACAALSHHLLTGCPSLRILATSREPLRIAGETIWPVPALALPDLNALPPIDQLARVEAVRLFVERARRALPDFALDEQAALPIAETCCRLAGSPLAIELAAARIRVLSPAQVAARLEDTLTLLAAADRTGPARHRTLQATLDWSYDLLSAAEQSLFRCLAVFAGSFPLDAVEAVFAVAEAAPDGKSLDLLSGLVDKSLLEVEPPAGLGRRYRYLEPVRQYALAKLEQSGEGVATRDRLLAWAATLADRIGPDVFFGETQGGVERLEQEYPNLRAALAWSLSEPGREVQGCRLAHALSSFWQMRGYAGEGLDWQQQLLARRGEVLDPLEVESLRLAGFLALHIGDIAQARRYLEQGLAVYDKLGDRQRDLSELASLLLMLAWTAFQEGDMVGAEELDRRSLAVSRACGDDASISGCLLLLADLAYVRGDLKCARVSIEESLDICPRHRPSAAMGRRQARRGIICVALNDGAEAQRCFDESLRLCSEAGDHWGTAMAFVGMAKLARERGALDRAAWLLGVVQVFLETSGTRLWPLDRMENERNASELRALMGEKAFEAARRRGIEQGRRDPDAAIQLALDELARREEPRAGRDRPPTAPQTSAGTALAAPKHRDFTPLTRREAEVAGLVAQGKSNAEIAAALFLGLRTVEAHVTHILNKLGFNSRAQIAAWVAGQAANRTPPPH
jgi:predicted ATPase/DNA-binding CsgD family transcriptional regulator